MFHLQKERTNCENTIHQRKAVMYYCKCLNAATANHDCLKLQCQICGKDDHCSTVHGLDLTPAEKVTSIISTVEMCVSPIIISRQT